MTKTRATNKGGRVKNFIGKKVHIQLGKPVRMSGKVQPFEYRMVGVLVGELLALESGVAEIRAESGFEGVHEHLATIGLKSETVQININNIDFVRLAQ